MFNFLLDVYNGGVSNSTTSSDGVPDGIVRGANFDTSAFIFGGEVTFSAEAVYKQGWNAARNSQTVVGTVYTITAHQGDWVKVQEVGTGYSRVISA